VTSAQALNVGYTFMRKGNNTRGNNVSKQAMQLVYTGQAYDSLTGTTTDCYYVFALQPKGFVIVAADDRVDPILGYSYDNNFAVANMPDHVRGWLSSYEKQIEAVVKQGATPTAETSTKWSRLRAGQSMSTRSGGSVGPLLTTQWDQWYPYNSLCPEGAPTGCVATATAQIVNYWQYPVKGVGYRDYSSPGNGIGHHQVAYNETYYQWDSMDVNHPDAIGTLMYHVGTSCGTHYNYGESGSSIESAMIGLQTYFDYTETMQYYRKTNSSFTDAQWIQLVKDNLDEDKPVLYAGGGHAWVIDGYDANDMFHMNFGWSGNADGYYFLDVIFASMYNLSNDPEMVVGVMPAYSNLNCEFIYQVDEYDEMSYTFHDFTTGTYEHLLWDFGDGDFDTTYNPSHTYTNDGLYTITLLTQQGTQVDSITKMIDIRHNQFFRRVPPYTGDPAYNPVGLIHPVDYDMDGRQDIVVYGMSGISLSHNTENGFVSNETTLYTFDAYDLQVVDFYNTNTPSLYSAKNASFWKNISGNYILDSIIGENMKGELIDYNNDGLVDIIGLNDWGHNGIIYRNIGKGKFLKVDYEISSGNWFDVDNDGDLDLISPYAGSFFNDIEQYNMFNDGHGIFHMDDFPSGIFADFNNDGLPDVLSNISGDINSPNRTLLINNGDHTFDTIYDATFDGYKSHADIDNDGYIEIFDGDSITKIMGDSAITFPNDYHIPWFSWGDPNGNNSIDVLSDVEWPWSDNHMGTYLNIATTQNLPPAAPTGLYADTNGNEVVLHWSAPMDDHTPSSALTYNIAVGSSPNTCDIYSPLSDLTTGHRYYMNRGNAGLATLWNVNELPNGTYYWRVQAIDQAMAASAFSAVDSFTITGHNIPPAMAEMKSGFAFGKHSNIDKNIFLEAYVDRDNDDLEGIIIESLPLYGTLSLYGNAVEAGQSVTYNELDSLCYFNTNYLNAQDIFYVKAFDGSDYSDFRSPLYLSGMLFESVEVVLPGGKAIWGDLDNDGDLDLATSEGIYQNTQCSFTLIHPFSENKTPIVWVDYNSDNRLDCLFADSLLVNDGNGGFIAQEMNVSDWAEKTDFNDLNNNNNIDFIFARNDSLFAKYDWSEDLYLNMQAMRDGIPAIGDWDNDGRQDLANSGFDWGNHRDMMVYHDSADLFVPIKKLEGVAGHLQWGDYDKDGDLDLLATGSDNNSIPRAILYKNVSGNLISQEVSLEGVFGNSYWLDFDNDGWLDVLLSGYYVGTRLYRNNQDGSFAEIPPEVSQIPTEIHSIAIGDYDNDGYMDVLLSGTYLMRNLLGTASDTPYSTPTPPVQLQSDVQGSHVTLSWVTADPTKHVSYNVYVRKEGETGYVVSPLADTASGFRKLKRLGNSEYKTFFNLNSLDEGTYWWSVQAVDNAYNGGVFAAEQSFTVTCSVSEPAHVYDTACHVFCHGNDLMTEDGMYMLQFESHDGCDSLVYLHLSVRDDCSAIVYVKPNGSDDNNGYSWQTAKASINAAIEVAQQNGDSIIWVAAGTYESPSPIYVTGVYDFSTTFYIPNGIHIYGGLSGNESETFDMSNRKLVSNATVLNGMNVCMVAYMEENTLLDGFIVQNGNGGGVQANSSSIVRNCVVRNNSSIWSAGVSGGTVINCLIYGNTSTYAGTVESCNVYSSTIANNYGDKQYYEHIPVAGAANSQLTNCILWNNQYSTAENCTMSYCATDADYMEGTGNILLAKKNDSTSSDSLYVRFIDPGNGDYHFMSGSACINAGTPDISALELPSVDLQGLPRVLDGRVDIGVYEYYPVPVVETYDTICEGNSVVFFDSVCLAAGNYVHHANAVNVTLDTVHVLHLSVNQSTFGDTTAVACESFTWQGSEFTTSGTYTYEYTNENGCASVDTLHLTVNHSTASDTTAVACDSFTWEGETHTTSGNYTSYKTNAAGCDSVITLHLTITNTDYTEFSDVACDSYIWNGETYTQSGDYTQTFTSAAGCDSVVTLHLTVNNSAATDEYLTICENELPYHYLNGQIDTIFEVGTPELLSLNYNLLTETGCDSVVTLHLTINYSTPPTVTTNTVSDITATSATCGGNVTADGGATVTARGVCWSTSENPTVADAYTTDGSGAGAFTSQLTNLEPATIYYVRAYATNSKGTAYGESVSFTTPLCNPLTVNILSANTSILLGESVTLSASGAESYSWNTGDTSSSITVFPTTTSTYTVTGTAPFGCEDVDSITITVNVVPETPVVTVDHDTVCAGAQVTLTVTNPIANISYIWYVNGMEIAGVSQANMTVFPDQSGSNTYSVMAVDNQGYTSALASVSVFVRPTPTVQITGNQHVCETEPVTMTANVGTDGMISDNLHYVWFVDGQMHDNMAYNLGDTNLFVEYLFPRSEPYHFSVQVSIGDDASCTSQSEEYLVYVHTQPNVYVVATETSICVGGSTTIMAVVNDFYDESISYNWSDGNSSPIYTFSPSSYGPYTFTVTVTSGLSGCSSEDEITIQVNEIPEAPVVTADNVLIFDGNQVTLSVTNPIADAVYTWYRNGFLVPEASQPSLIESLYTFDDEPAIYNYTVVATLYNSGCVSGFSDNTVVTVNPTPVAVVSVEGDTVLCEGASTTLHVDVTPPYSSYTYQWYMDDVLIPGATSADYVVEESARQTPYSIYVMVSANGSYTAIAYAPEILFVLAPSVTIQGADNISYGQSTTLTASGADTYAWSTGDHTASMTVSPTTTTTYTVTGSSIYGCTGTADVTVTVNPIVPTVTTDNVTDVTVNAAICGGNVTSDGGADVTARGICWSTSENPTVTDAHTIDGSGIGSFASSVTELATNTTYHVRAYATNSVGTAYGEDIVFTTICDTAVSEFNIVTCDSYAWNDSTYTTSGEYQQTFTRANGCDSIVTLYLTINHTTTGDTTAVANDRFDWYEHTYLTMSGDYTHVFTNQSGCDSVVTLHLTVNNPSISVQDTVMANGFFFWNGMVFTSDTVLTETILVPGGYDSVLVYHVFITPAPLTVLNVDTCVSYTLNGQTYAESGNYVQTFPISGGMDSIVVLYLTVNQPTASDTFVVACENFIWEGETYMQSGDYTSYKTNAAGCDSVVTLHLTINQPTTGDTAAIACDSFTWGGDTYTQSGDYTSYKTNAAGCDSVVTLHLTITNTDYTDYTDVACDSYLWNGETYTQSGSYTQTFSNSVGCDSVVTLHLTINQPTTGDTTAIACDSFTWEGDTYTQSGDYTSYKTNAAGCDSVVTLHLTITNTDHTDYTDVACDSYTWNGETYTQSGDYTQTFTSAAGCDSVVTLHLTVNNSAATDEYLTICENELPYHYINGQIDTIFEVGTPELLTINYYLLTEAGCDSVVTLHLTVSVGIEDRNLSASMTVYPNPTNGIVNVQCTLNNEQVGTLEYHVFDAYGKLVDVVEANNDSPLQTAQIDLSGFANGVYFVKAVADGNVVAVRKVVKR